MAHLSKSLQGSVLCWSGSAPVWPPLELRPLSVLSLRWTPGNVLNKEEKKKRSFFSLDEKKKTKEGFKNQAV